MSQTTSSLQGMVRVAESVMVSRPPAEVFAVLADPAAAARWQQGVDGVRMVTGGPPGPGSRMSGTREYAGLRLGFTTEITEWDPPRRLAFRSVGAPVRVDGSQALEAVPGGTRVTATLDLRVGGLGLLRLTDRVADRVAAELRRDLAALKALLEGGAATA